uniref:Lipocalin n=1 Tax=Rhipicephalus zambeziensis TaxID=60191 RepID=A0A224YCG8_9ACAR
MFRTSPFFYSYDSVIWTVKTTMETDNICKVDYVNKTTTQYAQFRRVSYSGKTRSEEDLNGTFIKMDNLRKSSTDNGMLVHTLEGIEVSTEELMREYNNYTCGIFVVHLSSMASGAYYYELRVKNMSIHKPRSSCDDEYRSITKYINTTQLYTEACQTKRQHR